MHTSRPVPTAIETRTASGHVVAPRRVAPRSAQGRIRSTVGAEVMPAASASGATRQRAATVSSATLPLPSIESATAAPQPDGDATPLAVDRAFAFVDISGFTAFCDRHGERAAIDLLSLFRSVTRDVAGRRGVRASKWLGDGVMLVSTEMAPLAAAVVELECRFRATGLEVHAGVAWGPVLLFEGDDYVGRTVNLAARLADAAGPGEVLAAGTEVPLPAWIERRDRRSLEVAGMGRVGGIVRLAATPEVERTLLVAA